MAAFQCLRGIEQLSPFERDHGGCRVQDAERRDALAEQQTIADAFRAEGLLPRAVDAAALPVWAPPTR